MNFALSDEQELLKEAARGALARVKTVEAAREALDGGDAARPVADRRRGGLARPAGLRGARRRRARRAGRDARVRRARAACSRRVPLLGHLPATLLLDAAGRRRALEALASGERRAAFVRRPAADGDRGGAGRSTRARACARAPAPVIGGGDGHRRGRAGCPTRRAPTCSSWSGRRRPRRARSRPPTPRSSRSTGYDATRSLGHVRFDAAPATRARRRRRRRRHRVVPRAGAARARRRSARSSSRSRRRSQYAKERFTFGRAIGSYQAVKHELVEILRRLENARSLMYYAGWAAPGQAGRAAARGVRVPARGRRGARPRRAHADLRARRHRRDVGARRAAVLPPRAALAAAARRDAATRPTAWPTSCSRRRSAARRSRGCDALWTHDRWRFPLPRAPPVPARQVRAAARAGGGGRRRRARTRCTSRSRSPWERLDRRARPRAARADPRRRPDACARQRGLGLPWSAELVERGRRSVGGHGRGRAPRARRTASAMNLGGGTHHAGRDFARGYCLFNDVAVALARAARRAGSRERALVVDCDVHQGDGTADLLGRRPATRSRCRCTARATTRSSASRPTSTSTSRAAPATSATSRRCDEALDLALAARAADFAFYLAGADPWEGDRLGRLALTKAGLRARDELVLDRLRAAGARRLRRARRRLRRGRRATRSTSTRRPRPRSRERLAPSSEVAPGGVVVMGARRFCIPEVGVRFPPPPCALLRERVDLLDQALRLGGLAPGLALVEPPAVERRCVQLALDRPGHLVALRGAPPRARSRSGRGVVASSLASAFVDAAASPRTRRTARSAARSRSRRRSSQVARALRDRVGVERLHEHVAVLRKSSFSPSSDRIVGRTFVWSVQVVESIAARSRPRARPCRPMCCRSPAGCRRGSRRTRRRRTPSLPAARVRSSGRRSRGCRTS